MTTIELTPEQIVELLLPIVKKERHQSERKYASLQRRTDARVKRAKARTAEWKQRYSDARKDLIKARSEINTLKRRLRDGDFE